MHDPGALPDRRSRPPRRRTATLVALVAVGLAQLGDLVTFVRMVEVHGTDAELNPIVSHAAATLGLPILVAAKIALVVLVVATFVVVSRVRRRVAASVVMAGTLAGLIGAYSNVLTI